MKGIIAYDDKSEQIVSPIASNFNEIGVWFTGDQKFGLYHYCTKLLL